MAKRTIQQRAAETLEKRGLRIEKHLLSRCWVAINPDPAKPKRYFLGSGGSIRKGLTRTASIPVVLKDMVP